MNELRNIYRNVREQVAAEKSTVELSARPHDAEQLKDFNLEFEHTEQVRRDVLEESVLADLDIVDNPRSRIGRTSIKRDAITSNDQVEDSFESFTDRCEDFKAKESRSAAVNQADEIRKVLGLWDSTAIPWFN
jgi:hypothetical protein